MLLGAFDRDEGGTLEHVGQRREEVDETEKKSRRTADRLARHHNLCNQHSTPKIELALVKPPTHTAMAAVTEAPYPLPPVKKQLIVFDFDW